MQPNTANSEWQNFAAIIVSYHPQKEQLQALISVLAKDLPAIWLIDNGSSPEEIVCLEQFCQQYQTSAKIKLIKLGENTGLAHAHNVGLTVAIDAGCDFVWIFDQDSLPAGDMLWQMKKFARSLNKFAALGPCYLDQRQQNPTPFIYIKNFRLHRHHKLETSAPIVAVDYVISSGALLSLACVKEIGKMRQDLFIDYIDVEWGLRAKCGGYQTYGVFAAQMLHDLGEQPINFFGKLLPMHSPLRHYYLFRNAILLYQQKNLPFEWKVVDAYRLLLRFIFYALFAKPQSKHLKMMLKGLYHGFRGKSGKL